MSEKIPLMSQDASSATLIKAVQYVRMSTEHQKYSTENQEDIIREYANRRGFEITHTYTDGGKSGLRIEGRDGLKQLIADVQAGTSVFKAILVYDISRWGRFQDTDESAYYEYICKSTGIQVHYCAEQFENDGSIQSTIFKSVKRAMAGEYSRELSTKVFKGQCRLIELGYRQGGPAGYGLRRMLIAEDGHAKAELKKGEHKSLQTDRVILVPGPEDEIANVRTIYQLFTKEGKPEREIAEILERRGIQTDSGRPWNRAIIHQILTNEKYIGNNVYNRVSNKLKKKRVVNPPEMWIRRDGAFDAVVDPESFFIVRGMLQERNRRFTNEEMIEKLKHLAAIHMDLSAQLIDDAEGLPPSFAYRRRFGSLIAAYRLAGYDPGRDYEFLEVNRRLRSLYPGLITGTIKQLEQIGAAVVWDEDAEQLLINGEYRAAIVISRCRRTEAGMPWWQITFDQKRPPDITVLIRMDQANDQPSDYYLLPLIDFGLPGLRIRECNGIYVDSYRFDTLSYFVELAGRVRIEVAA